MGSLFDELKKSKLINKERAKQLAHEARVTRKKSGGDVARDAELAGKTKAFEQLRAEERRQKRDAERARQAAQRDKAKRAEVKQLVQSRDLGEEAAGGRRWHFLTTGGQLPFLPVNESTAKRLEAGEYAIVADPNVAWPHYVLVPREVAQALAAVEREAVRFLAGA